MFDAWTPQEEALRLHARFNLLKAQGVGQAQFARLHGVPGGASMLSQHIKGRRPMSLEAAIAYAKGFKCSIAEISPRLAKEVREAENTQSNYANLAAHSIETAPANAVPVMSWVQAGEGETLEWLPCPIQHGPRAYALIVRGSSMYNPAGKPSFQDGDTIFVDPDRQAHHRSLVIARLDDEKEATFKQLLIEGEQRLLQALNPSWPERIIRINGNCTLSGVVIGKVESFI
jgi:SOS-response transcriptional repressor LexA